MARIPLMDVHFVTAHVVTVGTCVNRCRSSSNPNLNLIYLSLPITLTDSIIFLCPVLSPVRHLVPDDPNVPYEMLSVIKKIVDDNTGQTREGQEKTLLLHRYDSSTSHILILL